MKRTNIKRLVGAALLLGVIAIGYYFKLWNYVTIEKFQQQDQQIQLFVQKHYYLTTLLYLVFFTIAMILSLPISAPLTLIGGYLFGTVQGGVYAIVSATIGATISLFLFRYFLTDYVRERYGHRIEPLNRQFKKYGANYLLVLHFLSVVPFFIINMLAAVTHVSLFTFMWTTAAGIMPLLFVYAFVGNQLHTIKTPGDIFSPFIIGMLLLLGIVAMLPILIQRFSRSKS